MSTKRIRSDMPLRQRFDLQHTKEGGNGCWTWIGQISYRGYGFIKQNYESKMAHRVSYELHKGPIPEGLQILHSCDNTRCVNPEHLSVGTAADNKQDSVRKRRHAIGERIAASKLTEAQVRELRDSTENPKSIAPRYGIHWSQVYRIRKGLAWAHL